MKALTVSHIIFLLMFVFFGHLSAEKLRYSERASVKVIKLVEAYPAKLCYVTRMESHSKNYYFKDNFIHGLMMAEIEEELKKRGYEISGKKEKTDCLLSLNVNHFRARSNGPVKFTGFSGRSQMHLGVSNVRAHASMLLKVRIPRRKNPAVVYSHTWVSTEIAAKHNYWKEYSDEERGRLIMELIDFAMPKMALFLDEVGLTGPFNIPKPKPKPKKAESQKSKGSEAKSPAKPRKRRGIGRMGKKVTPRAVPQESVDNKKKVEEVTPVARPNKPEDSKKKIAKAKSPIKPKKLESVKDKAEEAKSPAKPRKRRGIGRMGKRVTPRAVPQESVDNKKKVEEVTPVAKPNKPESSKAKSKKRVIIYYNAKAAKPKKIESVKEKAVETKLPSKTLKRRGKTEKTKKVTSSVKPPVELQKIESSKKKSLERRKRNRR